MTVEDSSEHQGLVENGVDALLVGLNTNDTVLGERPRTVSEETDALEDVFNDNGLEYIQLSPYGIIRLCLNGLSKYDTPQIVRLSMRC